MAQRNRTAQQDADMLRANTDDFYADRITYEEHGRRQRANWVAIRTQGEEHVEAVLAIIRTRLYS